MQNTFLKKLVALMLAACFVLGVIPYVAFSDEQEVLSESPATEPTIEPTAEPTAEPTIEPTAEPTAEPTIEPTAEPTAEPTIEPTAEPMAEPTIEPTTEPTAEPTNEPAAVSTAAPTMPVMENAPLISENVQLVQQMIDALPAVDALNADNMTAAYQQTEAAYAAYLALSPDEQAQIIGAEKFAALFAVFNAQTATLEETETVSFTARQADGTFSSRTTTAGTAFLTYASNYGWFAENCLWKVTRDGSKLSVDASTVIQDGDAYELVWVVVNQYLSICGTCTIAELPAESTYTAYGFGANANVTVTHNLNGTNVTGALTDTSAISWFAYTYGGYSNTDSRTWYDAAGNEVTNLTSFTPQSYTSTFSLSVNYAGDQGTVTWEDGTVAWSTTRWLKKDETATLTIAPNGGYKLSDVKVNEVSIFSSVTDGVYTHTMGNIDTGIVVIFTEDAVSFTYKDFPASTTDKHAKFLEWLAENNEAYMGVAAKWQLTRNGAASIVTADTVIQEGDNYQPLWIIYPETPTTLTIYPGCTQDDLPASSAYTAFNLAGGATIDIQHIVNGAYKTFTVYSPYETALEKLFEVSTGTWCREDSAGENWQVVGDDDLFPLRESTFVTRYPITLNPPEHGAISISMQYSAVMQEGSQVYGLTGNPVRLTFEAESAYMLDTITVTGENGAAVTGDFAMDEPLYSFSMPGSAVTVTAAFRKEGEYRIAVADAAHGSISPSQSTARKDEVISVIATPEDGYHLACLKVAYTAEWGDTWENNWYDYGTTDYSFTMPESDITLTPTFLPNTLYNITIMPATGGTVTANKATACQQDRIKLTITPDEGYELDKVTITGINETFDGNGFFMDTSDVTVMVTFKLKKGYYTISVMPSQPDSDTGSVNIPSAAKGGSTVTFTAAPTEGYYLAAVLVDYEDSGFPRFFTCPYNSYDTTYTFTMPWANAALTPYFSSDPACSISIQNGTGGTVTANVNIACWRDEIRLTVTPDTYFQLKSLLVTDKDGDAVTTTQKSDTLYTFSMPYSNATVTAEFELRSDCYHINVAPYEYGTITVQPVAREGEEVTFTITPDNGYVLNNNCVTLTQEADGKPVSLTRDNHGNYSFTMPAGQVLVEAVFVPSAPAYILTIPSSVSLNEAQRMAITASDVENLNGQAISVAVTSANGGKLKSGEHEIGYSFTQSLSFTEDGSQNLALAIGKDETAGKPAGTYTDTLHFNVSLNDAAGE